MNLGGGFHFVSIRALTASIGIVRTIVVIRLLTLEDYAVVGIVESIRALMSMFAGLGVADAFEREVSIERDQSTVGSLFRDALVFVLATSLLISICLWVSSRYLEDALALHGAATAFAISGLVIVTERVWLLCMALVRRIAGAVAYLRLLVVNAGLGLAAAAIGVSLLAVDGYFHALWITSIISVAFAWIVIKNDFPTGALLPRIRNDGMISIRRLWQLSWTSFTFKASSILWRRMPLVFCSTLMDQRTVGAISVALDLTWKLHILQQALSPLAVSRLAPIFKYQPAEYRAAALRELREVALWTASALVGAMLIWELAGWMVVGSDRWINLRVVFYMALLSDVLLFAANVAFVWVLVPSAEPLKASIPAIMVRLLAPLAVWPAASLMTDKAVALFVVLIVSGFAAAFLLWFSAIRVLRQSRPYETSH